MRVVVAGATGLIGSRTVARLRDHGVEVVPVSRRHGVDVITGSGLGEALRGAEVVVDVTDAPTRTEEAGLRFFRIATANLLAAAASAGVEHHVVLSVAGAGRLRSGYFLAKELQEYQAGRSSIPHSIVRAALSFESLEAMALADTRPDGVHVAPALIRPVATDDVAAAVAHVAVGLPLLGTLEVAGPEEYRLDDLTAKLLAAKGDARSVVTDARARLLAAEVGKRALLPGPGTHIGHTTFSAWLAQR
ncbi:SDR family oxidoreductase [Streptomyces sp. NBC_01275]|uniref:SDR family oxidoreductase n=1 Tax=Streptomyces sp. NBC_01275 TaxID=2903807 RepID=UPI002250EDCB|nr:SDR family oxidoreductase [Streptomyces sp. NBC_01275]MCX4766776.1 SDR family oxidoreductase [Streptomyces sp. NBC_01275]